MLTGDAGSLRPRHTKLRAPFFRVLCEWAGNLNPQPEPFFISDPEQSERELKDMLLVTFWRTGGKALHYTSSNAIVASRHITRRTPGSRTNGSEISQVAMQASAPTTPNLTSAGAAQPCNSSAMPTSTGGCRI